MPLITPASDFDSSTLYCRYQATMPSEVKALTLIELFGLEFSACKLDSAGNDG